MPRNYLLRSTLTAVGLAILGVGCAPDSTTASQATAMRSLSLATTIAPVTGLVSGAVTNVLVPVVHRRTPLSRDITVTTDIGCSGGTIAIDEAGLAVRFAPGAVQQTTPITVTAYAGSLVSYGFGPHGIHFSAPVTIEQDADMITVSGHFLSLETLRCVHSRRLSDITADDGKQRVRALRPGAVQALPGMERHAAISGGVTKAVVPVQNGPRGCNVRVPTSSSNWPTQRIGQPAA